MEIFWKAAAILLLTVILGTAIGKTEKDIAVVLAVTACCVVLLAAVPYLSEVTAFFWRLANSMSVPNPVPDTLLKISGVAVATELIGLISSDAGSSSLEKAMQLLGNTVILFLSVPLFETFLSVIQEMLGYL